LGRPGRLERGLAHRILGNPLACLRLQNLVQRNRSWSLKGVFSLRTIDHFCVRRLDVFGFHDLLDVLELHVKVVGLHDEGLELVEAGARLASAIRLWRDE